MTEQQATQTTLKAMRQPEQLPEVSVGLTTLQGFELVQRAAKMLSNSTLVPAAYRAKKEKLDKYGNITESLDNPNALSNCVVALNMAQRMGADPLMIMQNLYIVEGRPSWSSQFVIAAINNCGRFSPLRFDMKDLGEKQIEYTVSKWKKGEDGKNFREEEVKKESVRNFECTAWAIEKETGERLSSPVVSIEMAVKEGWYGKNGSKWQTMPEVMLRYRSASFFGKVYAPELLMGLQSAEESYDIVNTVKGSDGVFIVTTGDLKNTNNVDSSSEKYDPATGEITAKAVRRDFNEVPPTLQDWIDDISNVPTLEGLEHKAKQAYEAFPGDAALDYAVLERGKALGAPKKGLFGKDISSKDGAAA